MYKYIYIYIYMCVYIYTAWASLGFIIAGCHPEVQAEDAILHWDLCIKASEGLVVSLGFNVFRGFW